MLMGGGAELIYTLAVKAAFSLDNRIINNYSALKNEISDANKPSMGFKIM